MGSKNLENTFKYASNNIKLLLKFKRWTQDDLCNKTGISLVTLRRRLHKNTGWSMLEAVSISNALGVPISELFFTEMIPNGNEQK